MNIVNNMNNNSISSHSIINTAGDKHHNMNINMNTNVNVNKDKNKHIHLVGNMISSFSFSYSSSLTDVDEKGSVEEVNGVAERVVAVVG